MKTSINIAYFSNQFASAKGHGIAHYSHRVYEGLKSDHADINVIPVATGCDRVAEEAAKLKNETGLQVLRGGRKMLPLAWAFMNAPTLEKCMGVDVDVTHMLTPGFPVATRKPLVLTVHDMGPLTHPEYFSKSGLWTFKKGIVQAVRQADAIVCVSNATADEFCGYAGDVDAKRIHVIHEGVDADCFAGNPIDISGLIKKHLPHGEPFFLASGAVSPRKNIPRLLKAFMAVKDEIPHNLVLTGGSGWDSKDVFKLLNDSALSSRVHHLGYVSDDQLQALYKTAEFYVHASLFEGFGLTVLEAMAAGCPVITSNISSLPEVAGSSAVLVDPFSVNEIAAALESFGLHKRLRDEYINKGILRAEKFRWEDTSRRIADIYRKLSE